MSLFRGHGLRELFSVSNGFLLRSHVVRYSISSNSNQSSQKPHSNLIAEYLIASLGFSRDAAIFLSFSPKVFHLKSIENAQLVVDFFKKYGFQDIHIRNIVSSVPKILNSSPNKTLEPKIRVFQELGFSGSTLFNLIKNNPHVLRSGLRTRIIPSIDLFRNLLGTDEKVIEAIKNSKWLISHASVKTLYTNVLLLQSFGLSNEKIVKFIISYPFNISQKPELFKSQVYRVEKELGISPSSTMFIHGVQAVTTVSKSMLEKKIDIFRSFGWSDTEVSTLLRVHPLCLTSSESRIHEKLTFFMNELKHPPSYLTTNLYLLSYSLEKRVKPRHKILEILKEKKLVTSKPSLPTITKYSEVKFQKFLERFKDEVPGICETYTDTMRKN